MANEEHLYDRGFNSLVMSACGLAAIRLRDGGVWWEHDSPHPSPELFIAGAKDAVPQDLTLARGTDYIRACAILVLAMVQDGEIRQMQMYLGLYHTLESLEVLCNEELWSIKDPVEVEERRCLVRILKVELFLILTNHSFGRCILLRFSHQLYGVAL